MTTKLSIKKKLLIYSFFIQIIILFIFSFSLYKSLEISTIDKFQATLKVITLDITDDVKEKDRVEDVVLDENKEYNFEPLFIRILDEKSHQKIIETQYFPQDIELNNKYLDSLKENIVIFKEQNNYLISRIKIDFNNSLKIIIEVATTKDIIWETLKELIYILAFIIPIILIFSIIGGNFLIYKSFAPIEKVLEELKNIRTVCDELGLYLMMDGARLGVALSTVDYTLNDLANICDVFYIGGTKVGALFGEAVVITNPCLKQDFRYCIKQKGGMFAKGRLLGVQFLELFKDGLYFEISKHAIDMAMLLKDGLKEKGYTFYIDSPTNQQFVVLENRKMEELKKDVQFSFWEKKDDTHTVVRFATSWATRMEDVEKLLSLL